MHLSNIVAIKVCIAAKLFGQKWVKNGHRGTARSDSKFLLTSLCSRSMTLSTYTTTIHSAGV